MEPCKYSNFIKDDRWKEGFHLFETVEGTPTTALCPNKEALEYSLMDNGYHGGITTNIYIMVSKCEGAECSTNETRKDEVIKNTLIRTNVYQPEQTLESHSSDIPLLYYMRETAPTALVEGQSRQIGISIDKHSYETQDNYAYIGTQGPSLEGEFYNVEEILTSTVPQARYNKNSYLQITLSLGRLEYKHERLLYSFLDVLADYGGVADIIIGFCYLFFGPYTELGFLFHAISNLYIVKTSTDGVVTAGTSTKPFKVLKGLENTSAEEDVKDRYLIKISNSDWFNLLFWKVFCCGCCPFN
jgi:hypothetical protein